MSPQRYAPVQGHDDDDSPTTPTSHAHVPSSPPPSFRSRASSPASRHLLSEDPLANERDQTLADAFDDGDGSDNEDEDVDDRQRLMRATPTSSGESPNPDAPSPASDRSAPQIVRRVTEFPGVTPPATGPRPANDGVFANLSAKTERGEKLEEQPPTYEQAAADAAPPYWETTIVAPGMASDEVYVDVLPVGSIFSFIWNGMISMSFQLVGFLLTYLPHTTHAAKNGSRAGLGLTLVQYGFYMKGTGSSGGMGGSDGTGDPSQFAGAPTDPNAHDFNPNAVETSSGGDSGGSSSSGGLSSLASSEWLSYILMIVGWFILIRAVSDFLRARRHEQLVLQSPNRGLPVPVVAEGETNETVV